MPSGRPDGRGCRPLPDGVREVFDGTFFQTGGAVLEGKTGALSDPAERAEADETSPGTSKRV
jgi:hypothetical protein